MSRNFVCMKLWPLTVTGLYDEAIEQHEEELGLCEALEDRLGVAIANRKLGECYAEKALFDKAFHYISRYDNIFYPLIIVNNGNPMLLGPVPTIP